MVKTNHRSSSRLTYVMHKTFMMSQSHNNELENAPDNSNNEKKKGKKEAPSSQPH